MATTTTTTTTASTSPTATPAATPALAPLSFCPPVVGTIDVAALLEGGEAGSEDGECVTGERASHEPIAEESLLEEEESSGDSNVALGQQSTTGRHQHFISTEGITYMFLKEKEKYIVTQSCLQEPRESTLNLHQQQWLILPHLVGTHVQRVSLRHTSL